MFLKLIFFVFALIIFQLSKVAPPPLFAEGPAHTLSIIFVNLFWESDVTGSAVNIMVNDLSEKWYRIYEWFSYPTKIV